MSRLPTLLLMLAGLAVIAAVPVPADGHEPSCVYWGYYHFPTVYALDYIPYYAQFPPVYYSYPVPRPYGYSPYAYPPGTRTPEKAEPTPVTIRNPFVPQRDASQEAAPPVAAAPLRQRNPFVVGAAEAAVAQRPRDAGR